MPEPFDVHEGVAVSLMRDNIDTDQIIPSREMKTVSRHGLADGLFAGWRYLDPDARLVNSDFVLNQCGSQQVSILISGENFGCGSSREHAVWALKEYGIRAILAKSFGEIFHGNCVRNGVLPIILKADTIDVLASVDAPAPLRVDLPKQIVSRVDEPGTEYTFDMDPFAKRLMVEGLDPISLTLTENAKIDAFFDGDRTRRPWVYSAA